MTTLINSNKEVNDMKIFKSLQESGLLIKAVSEQLKTIQKKKKLDFLTCC